MLDDYVRRGDAAQNDFAPVAVTAREREIIQLVAEGQSNKAAASTLGISVKTIEAHRANIMRKLPLPFGQRSRTVRDPQSNRAAVRRA